MAAQSSGVTRVTFNYLEDQEEVLIEDQVQWSGKRRAGDQECPVFAEFIHGNCLSRVTNTDSLLVLRHLLTNHPSAIHYLHLIRLLRPHAYSQRVDAIWKCEPPLPDVRRHLNARFREVGSSVRVICVRGAGMALSLPAPEG